MKLSSFKSVHSSHRQCLKKTSLRVVHLRRDSLACGCQARVGPTSHSTCEEARGGTRASTSEHRGWRGWSKPGQRTGTSTRAEGCEPEKHRQLIAKVHAQDHGSASRGRQEGNPLGGSEDVQGEPARHDTHEFVHVGEPGSSTAVAGVVLVVIGRGVVAAGPHGEAGESLTLNFSPTASSASVCADAACRGCAACPQRRPRNPSDEEPERR